MPAAGRIDTHHHVVPPRWADYLGEQGYFGGKSVPEWSPEHSLEFMDAFGVDRAVVSVSRPSVSLGGPGVRAAMARHVNDYCAGLADLHPGRFGFFATLPFPDVDACLSEIDRAVDDLGAAGVILLSRTDAEYVGADSYEPIFKELHRRGSVLFIHPTHPEGPWVDGIPPFVADFLLDTVRAATTMATRGVLRRYPGMRVILSHGGGFLPYAAERIVSLVPLSGQAVPARDDLLESFRDFYFDTALTGAGGGLRALLDFARPGRVLFGSDFPYATNGASEYFTTQLDKELPNESVRQAIHHKNAEALFSR